MTVAVDEVNGWSRTLLSINATPLKLGVVGKVRSGRYTLCGKHEMIGWSFSGEIWTEDRDEKSEDYEILGFEVDVAGAGIWRGLSGD